MFNLYSYKRFYYSQKIIKFVLLYLLFFMNLKILFYLYIDMYPCPQCTLNPKSHSFSLYNETSEHAWFYSSDHYTDRDADHIIEHIRGELEQFHKKKPGKKWSWLFDSHEFSFQWNTMTIIVPLIKLVMSYHDTFNTIHIIRPNEFIYKTIECCKPFLSDEMMKKIKIDQPTSP